MKQLRRVILGIGLILLAMLVLFKDSLGLPHFDFPLWLALLVLGFGYDALKNLTKRVYSSSLIELMIIGLLLNGYYDWIKVSFWNIAFAAILVMLGLHFLFHKKKKSFVNVESSYSSDGNDSQYQASTGKALNSDTVFGGATRYVNGDFLDAAGDVVFGRLTIDFSGAMILGDTASYSGDAVFSTVKLYVPQDWQVDVVGGRVFSSVKVPNASKAATKTLIYRGNLVFSSLEVVYI